jgi:hypothetical protein
MPYVERDFEKNPYTPDERRVAAYINEAVGIGGGDDPIEFLILSHQCLAAERLELKQELAELRA